MDNVCELNIEETNKLREKLGLKKLKISESNAKKTKDEKLLKRNDNAVEKKQKKIENIKVLDRKNKTKPIIDHFNDDIDDAENWVNKTRNIINKKLAQETIKYSDEEEEEEEEEDDGDENGTSDKKKKKKKKKTNFVSNLNVEHKNEDLTDNITLILKDTNVLDEEEDCLINEELKKKNVKDLISKNSDSYWNKNYYDPLSYYDDNNKNLDNEGSLKMIPKYEDEKHSFGISVQYDDYTHNSINKEINKSEFLERVYSREEDEKITRDTEEKEKKKNVNSALKLKKRKIKNINKRKKEDTWDFLYNEEGEEEKQKHKNEKGKEENEVNGTNETNENANILDDVIKKIQEEQANMEFNYLDGIFNESEEEKELYELLQKEKSLKKRKRDNKYKNELLKYIVINDEKANTNNEKNNNSLKLMNTSEFCKSIPLPIDIHENDKKNKMKKNEKDYINEDTLSPKNVLKENINDNILKNAFQENDEAIENEEEKEEKEEKEENKNKKIDIDDEISEGGVSKLFNEVELDEGLYGALKYLKTKGELNIEDKIYRNPENKPLHMSTDKNDIKLDYKNESGKVMTPKESFRYISWIFHGKKQGKNKLEKKIKRMETERRFKENPMDSLPTLNVMKQYQQTHKKSYFTISSNN